MEDEKIEEVGEALLPVLPIPEESAPSVGCQKAMAATYIAMGALRAIADPKMTLAQAQLVAISALRVVLTVYSEQRVMSGGEITAWAQKQVDAFLKNAVAKLNVSEDDQRRI